MAYKWEVYTEDKPGLSKIAMRYFNGATILRGTGFFSLGGNATAISKENAAIITVIQPKLDHARIEQFAKALITENDQSTVLLTVTEIGSWEVGVVKVE